MTNEIDSLCLYRHIDQQLASVWTSLTSREFLSSISQLGAREGAALRRSILRICGWLEDSVSSPLGSIFDRSVRSPLNAMLEDIAWAYGVEASFAGTTGTSGLNAPAVMTLAGEGQKLGVARDCHASIIGGLQLSGAVPVYLPTPFDVKRGINLPPSKREVEVFLDAHPDLSGLVLTVPTYNGLMGNIRAIVNICHRRGVRVMADSAHGPHYHFLTGLGYPTPAEDVGADMVMQSTHKVMSALNQGSLLHFNNRDLIPRYEEYQHMGFQSTSFSFLILLSIEHAVQQMVMHGPKLWRAALKRAHQIRETVSRYPGVRVLDRDIIDDERVVGLDPARVTINVRDTGLTGYQIAGRLRARDIIVEMATLDNVLLLVSPGVSEQMMDETLSAFASLMKEHRTSGTSVNLSDGSAPPPMPSQVLTPRQAVMTARERVPIAEAVGRVSAETIGCYPPGRAIFVAGERITAQGLKYLRRNVEAGGHLKRVQDDHFQTISVVIGH